MSKLGKLLLSLLIISIALNVVFLVSIVNLRSSIITESIKKNPLTTGYTHTYNSKKVSKIERIIKKQRPTFKMLNSAQPEYIGKKLILYGYATLSNYYNWGYSDAQTSHYSVKLENLNYEWIYIYFPKANNRKLFELLGQATLREKIPLRVEVIELKSRYEGGSIYYLAEGLSWKVLK